MGRFRDLELDGLELTGDRLLLRPWQPSDADAVYSIMQDREMHRFLQLPDPYTRDDAARYVTELAVTPRAEGSGLDCALVERTSGRLVGSARLRLAEGAQVGYWIAPDAQGNGYATEATRLLADCAFGAGEHRIELECDVRNLASARTALAAGFRFEGVARDATVAPLDRRSQARRFDLARFARLGTDPPERVPYAFPPLATEGLDDGVLRLRTVLPEDAPALAETDDELTLRWGFTGAPHTAEQVRRAADRAGLDWLVGTAAFFGMVDLETGRLAGSLRLRHTGPPQVGGIGYVVHPHFRGRRYTTRALRLLVPWAFDVAGYARLELGAKVGNVASLRAAAAAGFEPDGVRRDRLRNPDGTFGDEQRYAILNPRASSRTTSAAGSRTRSPA